MPSLKGFLSRFRRQRAKPTETVGVPGVAIYAGYVQQDETSSDLASHDARYRTYRKILRDTSIVAAGVRYFLNLIAKPAWSFTPSEADLDGEFAELAEAMVTDDPASSWPRIVRRAALYRLYGFSAQEWTARRRPDGRLTFADIEQRSQSTIERWDVDETGHVVAAIQDSPQTQQELYLPRDKLLYVVDDTLNDSPEGLGLFRHLVEPARRLERYELLEGYGFETDLRGIPVARMPLAELNRMLADGDISKQERAAMERPMRQFIEKHIRDPKLGLLLDSMTYQTQDESLQPSSVRMWDLELLKGTSASFAENAAAIERLNREMARIIGVEQLLLGSDSAGSFALSRDKTQALLLSVDAALVEIRAAVRRDLLRTLWRLNGFAPELMPEIATESVRFTDAQEIAATLRDMATAGAPLDDDDPVVSDVRDLMGVSRPLEVVGRGRADLGDEAEGV